MKSFRDYFKSPRQAFYLVEKYKTRNSDISSKYFVFQGHIKEYSNTYGKSKKGSRVCKFYEKDGCYLVSCYWIFKGKESNHMTAIFLPEDLSRIVFDNEAFKKKTSKNLPAESFALKGNTILRKRLSKIRGA